MLTGLFLAGLIGLTIAHEYLAAQGRLSTRVVSVVRRSVLVALIGFAVAFGTRAQVGERWRSALARSTPAPVAFDPAGDPMLSEALDAQQPERPFPRSGSADDVRAWQAHVVDALHERAGLSATAPTSVSVTVLASEDLGNVRRTLIAFEADDATRIPAYVHEPKSAFSGAAVLVVPGHGDGIRATSGILPDYQHSAALALAERGYVTLTPELRGFGLLAPDGTPAHRAVAQAALVAGSFYKAVVAKDLVRALTVLQQWRGVDPSRLAVVGASLGGELAVFLAALDPRARVIVSHSYGGTTGPESTDQTAVDHLRQTPHGCHTIPGVNRLVHREDWFALLAPRAVQVVRGRENVSQRAPQFQDAMRNAFTRAGASDRFEFRVEPGDHEFFVAPAAEFLSRWL
jgi:dienelactone hydrolase